VIRQEPCVGPEKPSYMPTSRSLSGLDHFHILDNSKTEHLAFRQSRVVIPIDNHQVEIAIPPACFNSQDEHRSGTD
jgi:hypothetical protein